jgi:hypothetical protein
MIGLESQSLRSSDNQARKTLSGKSSCAEIKGLNVMSSALPDVERFS